MPEEKEARMNLVPGIIAGITQQAGGDAAVANAAAQMEAQNNSLTLFTEAASTQVVPIAGVQSRQEENEEIADGLEKLIKNVKDGILIFLVEKSISFLDGLPGGEEAAASDNSSVSTPTSGAPMPPEDNGDEEKNEAKRSSSQYEDVTNSRSIRNTQTDLTREEFEQNLVDNGFTPVKRGGANNVTTYTKENVKYVVRDNATSTGGPSVDYGPVNGKATTKIRLRP